MVKKNKSLKVKIGGITVAIDSTDNQEIDRKNRYGPFRALGLPQAALHIHQDHFPEIALEKILFDSGGTWQYGIAQGKHILHFYSLDFGPQPYQTAVLKKDFTSGDVYLNPQARQLRLYLHPLQYPFDEIFFIHLFSQGLGILTHSCGINDHGRGILFLGVSGAGKSTMAKLWQKEKGVTILNDDRVLVREWRGKLYIFGTPWYGKSQVCCADKVPLEKIYFLKKENKNCLQALSPLDTASRIVATSFLPFWDKKGIDFALSFCIKIAGKLPAWEIGFVPDKKIINFVRGQFK